jgi:hypothetical protein
VVVGCVGVVVVTGSVFVVVVTVGNVTVVVVVSVVSVGRFTKRTIPMIITNPITILSTKFIVFIGWGLLTNRN